MNLAELTPQGHLERAQTLCDCDGWPWMKAAMEAEAKSLEAEILSADLPERDYHIKRQRAALLRQWMNFPEKQSATLAQQASESAKT